MTNAGVGRIQKPKTPNDMRQGGVGSLCQRCPSVLAAMGCNATHASLCAWPSFTCPRTPAWQMFSTCIHPEDSVSAGVWHQVRGPFAVPVGMQGHECCWEALDHHMAGCTVCGKVHRCEVGVCEEILQGEPGIAPLIEEILTRHI